MQKLEYSLDLRRRVIEDIELGNSQKTTSKIFRVSKSTVNRWWLRYKQEGLISPKPRFGSKGKIKIQELKNYVESR